MSNRFIPRNRYSKITSILPICCVDIVVVSNRQFLLVKRKENPAKNKWWFPGGSVFFNETLVAAVKRKLREEVNIRKIKSIKFLGVAETRFKKGYFGKPSHTINDVFLAKIDQGQLKNIKVDKFHSDYRWLEAIPQKSHPYLKKFLKQAGFK